MVSHVDRDHIVGVRKLFEQLKDEVDAQVSAAQRYLSVRHFWHNTFNDILGDAQDRFFQMLTASVQAAVGGAPNPILVQRLAQAYKTRNPVDPDAEATATDIAHVLASHADGRALRNSFKALFDRQAIATLNAPFKKNGQPTLAMLQNPVAVWTSPDSRSRANGS